MLRLLATGTLVLLGCSRPSPGPAPAASGSAREVAPAAEPMPAALPGKCGNLNCRIYGDAAPSFRAVLDGNPRILGVGEAHALAGSGVESATRRFTRELLPLLKGRATDLVVEVLLPNPKCQAKSEAAKKEQKVVTDKQAPTDQNEFVALGTAARELGIRPFALEPTCDDLARIAKGGAEAVAGSLEAITRLSTEKIHALRKERGGPDGKGIIVLYGGAMHNDAVPGKGKELWSYGAAARDASNGRYVEVDLFVPEYVKKTPAWESLPWYSSYDAAAHPREVTLFELGPASFVVMFQTTPPAPP